MTAKEELAKLADEEARILDALSEAQSLHQESELLLDQAHDDKETALAHISILDENYKVMKHAAPVVKIDSFAQVTAALGFARGRFTKASGDVNFLTARLEKLIKRLDELEAELQGVCDQRARFGRILPFRRPHDRGSAPANR